MSSDSLQGRNPNEYCSRCMAYHNISFHGTGTQPTCHCGEPHISKRITHTPTRCFVTDSEPNEAKPAETQYINTKLAEGFKYWRKRIDEVATMNKSFRTIRADDLIADLDKIIADLEATALPDQQTMKVRPTPSEIKKSLTTGGASLEFANKLVDRMYDPKRGWGVCLNCDDKPWQAHDIKRGDSVSQQEQGHAQPPQPLTKSKTNNWPCSCQTCSGYCTCEIPGHHDDTGASSPPDHTSGSDALDAPSDIDELEQAIRACHYSLPDADVAKFKQLISQRVVGELKQLKADCWKNNRAGWVPEYAIDKRIKELEGELK